MGQLTEIYNRLGEEFDKASREHFDAALNGKRMEIGFIIMVRCTVFILQ